MGSAPATGLFCSLTYSHFGSTGRCFVGCCAFARATTDLVSSSIAPYIARSQLTPLLLLHRLEHRSQSTLLQGEVPFIRVKNLYMWYWHLALKLSCFISEIPLNTWKIHAGSFHLIWPEFTLFLFIIIFSMNLTRTIRFYLNQSVNCRILSHENLTKSLGLKTYDTQTTSGVRLQFLSSGFLASGT